MSGKIIEYQKVEGVNDRIELIKNINSYIYKNIEEHQKIKLVECKNIEKSRSKYYFQIIR